jgi:hypothetical protein
MIKSGEVSYAPFSYLHDAPVMAELQFPKLGLTLVFWDFTVDRVLLDKLGFKMGYLLDIDDYLAIWRYQNWPVAEDRFIRSMPMKTKPNEEQSKLRLADWLRHGNLIKSQTHGVYALIIKPGDIRIKKVNPSSLSSDIVYCLPPRECLDLMVSRHSVLSEVSVLSELSDVDSSTDSD